MSLNNLIPTLRASPLVINAERIFGKVTDFIRGNPIVSTAAIGAGVTGLIATAAIIKAKKKKKSAKKKSAKKKSTRRKTRKRKSTRKRAKCRRKHRIIKHSGKGTKGKFKLVKFRDKRTGKMVSFKARRK